MPPAVNVWYFGPVDGNGMVTCHDAIVTHPYPDGKKDLRYFVGQTAYDVAMVPHGSVDYHAESYRTKAEAGQDCTDGGMSSFR